MHGNFKDITGKKYNMLTAIELIRIEKNIGSIWRFKCDCGNEVELPAGRVKSGNTSSCGCSKHKSEPKEDLTGKTFGKWTVIRKADTEKRGVYWHCKCQCGNVGIVKSSDLKSGKSTNCGCSRAENLIGKRYGKLTVLKRSTNDKDGVCWLCKCDCGREVIVSSHSLKRGRTKSCGCICSVGDLSGKRFGRLLVIKRAEDYITKNGKIVRRWECVCDCGTRKIIRQSELLNGHTQSCGCLHREEFGNINRTHGLSNKCGRLYFLWKSIKYRCYCENSPDYKNYGGRGITMCDEWKNNFKAFYDWAIANGYKEEKTDKGLNILTIDRIDVNGNYEPSNCRFVTNIIQANNKRNTRYIKINGEIDTVSNMARRYEIPYNTILKYSKGKENKKYSYLKIEVI